MLGSVNTPSASLHKSGLPACEATVIVVLAVKLTVDLYPALINPASDLTGPEKVDLAILSLLNKFYRLGLSARSVDR
jgi:hypothetical protein